MFVAEINFDVQTNRTTAEQQDEVDVLLGLFRMDGRILGRELLTIRNEKVFKSFLAIPDKDAFKKLDENPYIKERLKKLKNFGLTTPKLKILGEEISESVACRCKDTSAYILFTTYLSIQSPLRCFDCFSPIPLYRISRFETGDYHRAISWQSDYSACDSLQMNCTTGERFGTREMTDLNSSLSKQGIKICNEVKNLTNKNCYYYLYKYNAKSLKSERERKCPSCGGDWLLSEKFFKFDFKCDRCHLLSNISFNLR